jgi:hypothetical protein
MNFTSTIRCDAGWSIANFTFGSFWGTQEGQNRRRAKPKKACPFFIPRLGARVV